MPEMPELRVPCTYPGCDKSYKNKKTMWVHKCQAHPKRKAEPTLPVAAAPKADMPANGEPGRYRVRFTDGTSEEFVALNSFDARNRAMEQCVKPVASAYPVPA